ncbi:serine/threonine-protein kinase [Deinococcus ruber]|uniref:Serine/threonine protein kinase n=1 Tax=Deinococcus ruber TaxID=1848197 RepID=A0A918BYV2_9DEIO|nr:serine/threonine-protein kinase [Deinococcus ruber]GGQ95743.1 serine/threonine protein kinase [Deinococcus ruber]
MSLEPEHDQNALTLVSGYRLLRGLGRGNTSRVYLAEKIGPPDAGRQALVRAGQRVALKLPLADTLGNPEAATRFGNEVRLSLQFRHPHLVQGLDGTSFGSETFLSMRYYHGGTLARELTQALLPLPMALRVLADVASGLAYLHANDAVHQDVKTQNVYLHDGRAALGDFGSTYFQAQGGRVSGSPFYMAPEVYQGQLTGASSDVYSFGVLAHELLTGIRPHQGQTYEALMVSHLTHFPPQLSVQGVPRSVARLLDQALAKKPESRPTSALLRRALLGVLGESDEQEPETPSADAPAASTANRASVGRHGPQTPAKDAATPPAAAGPTTPKPSAPAEKRSWNPFRKK